MRALMLAVGDERYAVALDSVREVIENPGVVHVPSRHRHVYGVLNMRGEVIPALDTGRLLGGAPVAPAADGVRWWAIVEGAGEVCALATGECPQILDLDAPAGAATLPAVSDRYLCDGAAVALLDLDALLDLGDTAASA
jgi:chemotaxis signal transduction protein